MTDTPSQWVDVPKFFTRELKCCRRVDNKWEYTISPANNAKLKSKTIQFDSVHIQGVIDQKPCDDVMILADCTGKVKLSNCTAAVQNISIQKGDYCSVLGEMIREKGLPEITPQKMISLKDSDSNPQIHSRLWPVEVQDYQFFILGIINPNLT